MGRGLKTYIRKEDELLLKQIKKCMYCNVACKIEIEHIIPINKGGTSEKMNLTTACGKCNRFKSDFTVDEFLKRMLKKRELELNNIYSYSHRLRYHRKRKTSPEFQLKLIERINSCRVNHTYYTAVIHSIINKKYLLQ